MVAPNLLAPATITAKTGRLALTTSGVAIANNAAASGMAIQIDYLVVSNVDGINAADVDVYIFDGTTARYIGKGLTIEPKTSIEIFNVQKAFYLEEGDSLRLLASAVSDLEAVCSYKEIS